MTKLSEISKRDNKNKIMPKVMAFFIGLISIFAIVGVVLAIWPGENNSKNDINVAEITPAPIKSFMLKNDATTCTEDGKPVISIQLHGVHTASG